MNPAPHWAAPFFLLLAASLAVLGAGEAGSALLFAVAGFLTEILGVHTGFPFGHYVYTDALGPSLFGVPLAISCAWVTLLVWSRDVAWRATARRWKATLCGAALMTAADLLIDPVATRVLGYWRWTQGGIFFGVPLVNFLGWFAVSAVLLATVGKPARSSNGVLWTGVSVVVFFAIIAATAWLR